MDALAARTETTETSRLGTRFLVFPQPYFVPGYEIPEVIWVSSAPDRIGPGPSDARAYVVDPVQSKDPYHFPYLPPYAGLRRAPAQAGPDGHFDHLAPGSREFLSAHAFACVRRVQDICESYLGRRLPWFFAPTYERLEIVPWLPWDNAQSGFGFLELGESGGPDGRPLPFALNFDVLAHETGHAMLLNAIGLPRTGFTDDYLAYHEAVADFISLISLLHFDSALDKILRRTRGNLFLLSELDRVAELTEERQIRLANHSLRLTDVGHDPHDHGRPLLGALYDSLVYLFQQKLVERGLTALRPRDFREIRQEIGRPEIEGELATSQADYELVHYPTKSALIEARDAIASILFKSWAQLEPDGFDFAEAAEALLVATHQSGNGRYADLIEDNLAWRGLFGFGPSR